MPAAFRRQLILGLLIAMAWPPMPAPVAAWHIVGHRLIALMAYEQLTPSAQTRLNALLAAHESFATDFERSIPAQVRAGEVLSRERWLATQAAVWPDLLKATPYRPRSRHERASWHYVNLPVFADDAAREELTGRLDDNVAVVPDLNLPEEKWNVVQALRVVRDRLVDAERPAGERAIDLCWLLHLVADVHQPLHAASYYSPRRFPQGDRGGNQVPVRGHTNLHLYWDETLGGRESIAQLASQAAAIWADVAIGDHQARAMASLDVEQWAAESRDLAATVVYDAEVRAQLEAGPPLPLKQLHLSDDYTGRARRVAQVRAKLAAARLAALLNQLLVAAPAS